ncbi:uncharacterized protein LOC143213900 isoform X2 [Lasioglossum baleicum]|uniref:uncharacterized protein LOC143213900 isoform X2 n=1 Tax=Lasioglossum baleicum TaxID=434251 RepID=UPI003FCDA104
MDWGCKTVSLLLALCILLATVHRGDAERKVVCYYTNWSIYRPGTAKFSPQNINPYLCTHLIYAFGGFTKENALKPFDKYQDIEKGGYAKFTGLKTYNKNLKTLLAIGGWNEGSSRFSPMVADQDRRREFVKNSVKFLRKNHFDGLDLDWEYPAFRDGGKPRDKDNYASLVQELREEFDKESSKTGRPRLLLSLAMPAGIEYIDKGYDVPRLNEYLDFINLLSYDYHSSYEPAVNHHSPLYPLEEDNEYNYDSELTIDYTINYLLKKGASPEKIILGIPTYGRSYTLFNRDATELGAPADGPGTEGDATREKGYLAYYEICESLSQSDDWEVVQPNSKAMGPYAFKDDQWVGYDDEDIVKLKAKYANEKNLGGIMFWTIDNDDFRGKCHDRPYPLIEAAKQALLTDSTNAVQKSQSGDNRKKTRLPTVPSNSGGRRQGSGSRRSTTTAAPITKKRVTSPRPKFRTYARPKASREEDEEDQDVYRRSYSQSSSEEDDSDKGNAVKAEKNDRSREKGKSRPKNQSIGSSSRNRRKQTRRKQKKNESEEESLSNQLTTPEPPTTPDPGTDFKCEDEGFFPHPRDCKKYFWCLDSGPGGLGVVAHQFTCPSGLVFNKAADSCDYPRNVICPKTKTSSQATASTTRAPITAATSRTTYLYSSTRKPTTEKPEEEEYEDDYEGEDESEEEEQVEEKKEPSTTTTPKPLLYKTITRNKPTTTTTTTTEAPQVTKKSESHEESVKILGTEDEEDPKVIKELIMLIKKAGGIEELEKQLYLQSKGSDETSVDTERVTPATISRSLYERVLNRQSTKVATSRASISRGTSYANGPGGAQFEGLDEVPEVKNLRRSQKPQYVTIERPRPSTKEPPVEDEEEVEDDEELDDDTADVASSEERTVSNPFLASSTQRATPNYFNIRRARPSSTTSRNENDVELKDDEEEEAPVRSRRPTTPSSTENSSSEDKEEESRNSSEENPTTKSRYVNIQRFRSTTSRPLEVVSESSASPDPVTQAVSIGKEEEKVETSTATSTSTPSSTTVAFTTANSIVVEEETERSGTNESAEAISSSTTETVRLVEDSATEILLTTAPAGLSSTLSAPNSRSSAATVSQPRPFGLSRRSRPTTEPTTPLPGSKVSIPSRNVARPTFLAGRGRLRSRQEKTIAESESPREPIEDPGLGRPGRSRQRGTSRYTPPTFKAKAEEPSNSLVRERGRASSTESTPEPVRRRLRKPILRAVTEHSKGNELEDSPIVRITQGPPNKISSRSRSVTKQETNEEDRITNIRIFKKPASSRDIDARARYTRKRNDVEEAVKTAEVSTSTLSTTVTTTSKIEEEVIYDTSNESITEEPRVTTASVSIEEDNTTTDPVLETNTVESVPTTESIGENEVVTATDSLPYTTTTTEPLQITTTVGRETKVEEFNPDIIKIVFNANASSPNQENGTVMRRRKVLLRKRPVTSTTSASQEDEEEQPTPRRRKVVRRFRIHQNASTPADVSSTEDDRIVLRFTTPKDADLSSTLQEDVAEGTSTETIFTSTAETAGTIDYALTNDYTSFETPTAGTSIDEDFEDPDTATMASTVLDNFTVASTERGETLAETASTESTTSPTTFVIRFTSDVVDETTADRNQPEAAPTVALTTTSLASQGTRRLEPYNRTYYQDSRFVRKKFVRRRPIELSENIGGQNVVARTPSRAFSSTEVSNPEVSKRRKSLFIRRRPVSSTTARTTQTAIEEEPEEETELSLEEEDVSLEATPRTNRANVRPVFEVNLPAHGDSNEFWSRFTTPSLSTGHLAPLTPQILLEEALSTGSEDVYRSTPGKNRKPESRPRYRVPESLRKVSTESSYLADSSPEESEESNDSKLNYQGYRQPRTRGRFPTDEDESVLDATQSPSFDSSAHVRTRFYARRPTSTENPVTETLIPAKKFDYVADAHRRLQQSLRTTPKSPSEDSTKQVQNIVDDYTTTPSAQPLVTRLVTSVEESATTERQKILIKTKYSSLTSTTRIPVQTTASSIPDTLSTTSKDSSDGEDESANEIRQGQVERSTLPIEGEFLHRTGGGRLTTESQESSTIEIESVFSNLIAGKDQ